MKKTGKSQKTAGKRKEDEQLVVDDDCELLEFLLARLPGKGRQTIKAILRDRQVSVDGRSVSQYNHPLRAGQQVRVRWEKMPFDRLYHGIQIVFEDQDLLVIDKPAGLLTVATDTEKRRTAYSILSDYVKTKDAANRIFIIHRIDRETSGLLLFAKSEKIKDIIQETWMSTITERVYVAVVEGRMEQETGVITSWLTESSAFKVYSSQNPQQGKKAITHYTTIANNQDYSLLEVSLETGRKHQIRVHLQDIGHPVVGDVKYGLKDKKFERMALHARSIAFNHPHSGKRMFFEAPVPKFFGKLMKPE